jgi:hypothetical protein
MSLSVFSETHKRLGAANIDRDVGDCPKALEPTIDSVEAKLVLWNLFYHKCFILPSFWTEGLRVTAKYASPTRCPPRPSSKPTTRVVRRWPWYTWNIHLHVHVLNWLLLHKRGTLRNEVSCW